MEHYHSPHMDLKSGNSTKVHHYRTARVVTTVGLGIALTVNDGDVMGCTWMKLALSQALTLRKTDLRHPSVPQLNRPTSMAAH